MSSSKMQEGKPNAELSDASSTAGHRHDHPRRLTAVACTDCRKRKRKCDGKRPTCSACANRALNCIYETAEGHTRSGDLKSRVRSLTSRLDELEFFVNQLRYGSDFESSFILARLRTGESVTAILDRLNDNMTDSSPKATGAEHIQAQPSTMNEWRFASPMEFDGLSGMLSESNSIVSSTSSGQTQMDRKRTASTIHTRNKFGSQDESTAGGSPQFPNNTWLQSMSPEDRYQHSQLNSPHQMQNSAAMHGSFVHAPLPESSISSARRSSKVALHRIQSTPWSAAESNADLGHVTVKPFLDATGQAQDDPDERIRQRELFNDRHKIGSSITVSSNLFRGTANPSLHNNDYTLSRSDNLVVPLWAIMSMHQTGEDEKSRMFLDFYAEKKDLIKRGVDPDLILGTKPDIQAIMNEDAFARASDLSKWIARLVSGQEYPSAICRILGMWWTWHLMRWHINPTPETYDALPQWYRPTPCQLFYSHPVDADFHVWPAFRDVVIQRLDLQLQSRYWWDEAAKTVDCNWPGTLEEGVCVDAATGEVMLSPLLIQHASVLENWTVDPCIRKYIPNADSYMKIKYPPARTRNMTSGA